MVYNNVIFENVFFLLLSTTWPTERCQNHAKLRYLNVAPKIQANYKAKQSY